MADFLSRESELLGDEFGTPTGGTFATADGDFDFDAAASQFPDIDLDGSGDIPALPAAAAATPLTTTKSSGGFSFDGFDDAPPFREARATDVKVTGDDEITKFESEFPDIEVPGPTPQPQLVFGSAPTFAPKPQPSALSSTPILNHTLEEDEPDVIKQWREKRAEEIKARDDASKAKRLETISKAEAAIDAFYEEYARKKERNIRENKESEEEFLAQMSESLSTGTTWQRICDLVDLQNSQSKTIARAGPGTTDLTRFKEVLLRLKREGESAPGAAGY